ncbi:hypothetical protein N2K95_09825 [Arthrobacter zhaoxinii]|uniref:Uncharacterized protein n=1 Tax=Arthrobacter zhaoxinii TaxID=2964616 RepID=A0ABY5YLM8_9MICC|nr:hypothetical protein [Arthrobacter zhaoxinii]UWX95992.1 hypothetical protein N2K95_09825 [Arthrobacter zhaoxinii]
MTNGPESAPRRSRRAADVPVDSPAGPRERESQQRARDREALRAYKALTETQERRDPESALPTRRQLRQQQQQRAAAAGALPGTTTAVSSEPVDPSPAVSPTDLSAPDTSSAPVPARRERRRQESQRAAAPAEQETRHPATEAGPSGATESVAEDPAAAAGTDPNADVEGMSVEQALAARQALEGQARNQVAAMEALQSADPQAVDLELLAQQKALAERAKVLNRRTEVIRKLSEENEQRRPSTGDPSTAHNLAMVTPLEFVSVPGMEHPVMKAPPTSHVPIVTAATQRAAPAAVPAQRPASVPRRVPVGATDVRRSRALARTDAPVSATPESEDAATPVGARSAFGLDPLDVMTAGLGRTRKLRFAAAGVAGLGALALIVGILMIVGRLGS